MLLPKKVGSLTLVRKLGDDASTESFLGILDNPAGKQVVARRLVVLPGSGRLAEVRARVQDLMDVRDASLTSVLDIVEEETEAWVLEDWVEGVDLATVIDHCATTRTEVPRTVYLNIATQICNGLEALHSRAASHSGGDHVLHQAIAPHAIRLCADGRVLLGGYGLLSAPTASHTGTGPSGARIEYLAPEQTHQDQPLSPASDVFSLGAVLYELLTMQPMFRAESNLQTIHKVRRAEVTTQLLEVKEVLPGLDKVLFRALSLNPRHRYQRAFVLREDLRGLMAGFSFADIEAVTQEFIAPILRGNGQSASSTPSSMWGPADESTQDADTVYGGDTLGHGIPGEAAAHRLFDESDTHLGDDAPTMDSTVGAPSPLVTAEIASPIVSARSAGLRPATAYDDEQPTRVSDASSDPRLSQLVWGDRSSAVTDGGASAPDVATTHSGLELESLTIDTEPSAVQPASWDAPAARPPLPDPRATPDVRPLYEPSDPLPSPPTPAASVMYDEDEEDEEEIDWAPYAAAAGIASLMLASLLCVGIVYLAPPFLADTSEPPSEGIVAVAQQPVPVPRVVDAEDPSTDPEPVPALEPEPAPAARAPAPRPRPTRIAVRTPAPPRETFDAVVRTEPTPAPRVAPEPAPAPAPAPRRRAADPSFDPFEPSTESPWGDEGTTAPAAAAAVEPAPAEEAPTGASMSGGALERLSGAAFDGRLSGSDAQSLADVPTSDLSFTRARTLLYLDAKARGANDEQQAHLALLMSVPENRYNPVLLVEEGREAIGRKDWNKALDSARLAERHWARLPSDLVFTRKALIYEIQALGNTGQFYGSEGADTNALAGAIRGWEKYRRHVRSAGRTDLEERANQEISSLQEIQERMKP